ncbi:MAG: serine hydrolase [Anaerolineae bacterium]|nr:serine hydrolase [Anaerolineae bacterium]
MKRLLLPILIAIALSTLLQAQSATGVFAEAIGTANLRAGIGTEQEIIGEIQAGTRYPVIGRSEFFPWLLLGDPTTLQPLGWVFQDLVTVSGGDLRLVPFSTLVVGAIPTMTATPPITNTPPPGVTFTPAPTLTPSPTFAVYGIAGAEINIRYGPGADYPRVGVGRAGDRFEIVGYHTQFRWVQVRYAASPGGVAWISQDVLQIEGDLLTTNAISQTNFNNLPTLTPTSAVLQQSNVQRTATPVPVSPEFEALGQQLTAVLIENGFDPITSRFGAFYVRDLRTGQELIYGNNVAFSGTSVNKIPILIELFGALNTEPDEFLATNIANTMICSDNTATNRLIEVIGGGDLYAGAERVTGLMRTLGLQNSFLTAPYEIPGATPIPPTRPIQYPVTTVDQQRAQPNVTNQITVDDLGYLLSDVYACAFEESGPLLASFPEGTFTPQECRRALHVMANNNVDGMMKAGVPEGVVVAHKHGWVSETHTNAGIFFTPGGDYVIVMALRQEEWLAYDESLPVFAEVGRLVYNFYNPDAPQPEIREGFIPDAVSCNFASSPLVADLASPGYGAVRPENTWDIIDILSVPRQ